MSGIYRGVDRVSTITQLFTIEDDNLNLALVVGRGEVSGG